MPDSKKLSFTGFAYLHCTSTASGGPVYEKMEVQSLPPEAFLPRAARTGSFLSAVAGSAIDGVAEIVSGTKTYA
jgi:hypothetical protein